MRHHAARCCRTWIQTPDHDLVHRLILDSKVDDDLGRVDFSIECHETIGLGDLCPQRGKVFGLQIGDDPVLTKDLDVPVGDALVIPKRPLNQLALFHLSEPVSREAISKILDGELAINDSGGSAPCVKAIPLVVIHVEGLLPRSPFRPDLHLALHPHFPSTEIVNIPVDGLAPVSRGMGEREVLIWLRRSIGFAGMTGGCYTFTSSPDCSSGWAMAQLPFYCNHSGISQLA